MAAESMGILSVMSLVSLVFMSTSRGRISENAGTNSTSSNVRPSMKFLEMGFVAICENKALCYLLISNICLCFRLYKN
jgi:hypothetical protein